MQIHLAYYIVRKLTKFLTYLSLKEIFFHLFTIEFLRKQKLPGKNPGTSTNVMIGILNASQNRTNRAPFTEALISRQPEKY